MKPKLLAWLGLGAAGLLAAACSATPAPTRVAPLPPLRPSPTASLAPPATATGLTAATPAATPVPAPATATPAPPPQTATPAATPAPELRRLTGGGCCSAPFWSADSRQVRFIDRPASRPAGVYGVDVARPGSLKLVSERIVNVSGGGDFYVYPEGETAVVERVATGEKYVIPNGGRPVSVSLGGQYVLWQVRERRGNFDRRRNQIWVADVDGGNARVVAETIGGSWAQWIDGGRVLLVGLPLEDLPFVAIASLTLATEASGEQLVQLAQVARPRDTSISPGGDWLIYFLTFQDDAGDDGFWLVPTAGGQWPRKLDFFGSFRWRDEARLLYVPLEPGVESHALWEYDVAGGASRRLTDPAQTPFKIANDDWAVSPDGRYVVFVSAADHNLWLIDLAPGR